MRNICFVIIHLVFLFNCFADEQKPLKEAVIIILGAGNNTEQEYSPYVKSLNEKGYTVYIQSFDTKYSDGDWTGLNYDISVLEDGDWVKYGLNNEKFKHINHITYEGLNDGFITSKYNNLNNSVNLIRYGTKVLQYNRAGMYIKDMVKDVIAKGIHLVFIDSNSCGEFQGITVELFNLYKEKAIFLHAVQKWVQPVTSDLINQMCKIDSYEAFGCEKTIAEYTKNAFNAIQNINKITANKPFKKLTRKQKEKLKNSLINLNSINSANNLSFTPTCISQALKSSKFTKIDNEVVEVYITETVNSIYKKLANKD